MFAEYLDKAMHMAKYELIDDGTYFGEIPGFEGAWGNGKTLEACRDDLKGALEGWLLLGLWQQDESIPVLGRISLVPKKVKSRASHNEPATTQRERKAS